MFVYIDDKAGVILLYCRTDNGAARVIATIPFASLASYGLEIAG